MFAECLLCADHSPTRCSSQCLLLRKLTLRIHLPVAGMSPKRKSDYSLKLSNSIPDNALERLSPAFSHLPMYSQIPHQ